MMKVTQGDTRMLVRKYIDAYWVRNKYAPSIREIKDGVGLSSTSVANFHVRKLQKYGYLAPLEPGISRQIMPMWVRDAVSVAAVEMFGGDQDA